MPFLHERLVGSVLGTQLLAGKIVREQWVRYPGLCSTLELVLVSIESRR